MPLRGSDTNGSYEADALAAISAVLDFGIEAIAQGQGWDGPIPHEAIVQARRAAQIGIGIGGVLRRYIAGHRVLIDLVVEEAKSCGAYSDGHTVREITGLQEALLERLTAAVEAEWIREREALTRSSDQRRVEIVRGLLNGEPVTPVERAELDYELDNSWHLGVTLGGVDDEGVRASITANFQSLVVSLDGFVQAWIASGSTKPDSAELAQSLIARFTGAPLALGEPGQGLEGWRLTHNQARAAMHIALRRPTRFAQYADDRLLATAILDDTLTKSLRQSYTLPLTSRRDGGEALRRTLRRYIDLECNATSAAHALGIERRTVKHRVHTAERLIGCKLHECLTELDIALRLDELERDITLENTAASR